MSKTFAKLPSPVLAGVVREQTAQECIAEIKNCMYDGAGMIDLHLSCLQERDNGSLKKIISSTKLPVLALNYNKTYDWQDASFTEEERVQSLLDAVDAGAVGIDMQGYTFHRPSKDGYCGDEFCGNNLFSFTKGNPKEVVTDDVIIQKQCDLIEKVHQKGAEVLLSCHPGIAMDRFQIVDLALFLERRKPDVIKIVTPASNEEELLESIKTMLYLKKEVKTPISYHANGPMGGLSRVVNPALGGHMAFCVDRFNAGSTMVQIDLKTAKSAIENIIKVL